MMMDITSVYLQRFKYGVMSELKIGDKVKFLNASGGGVVAKLIDSRTVSILIEDGFEIPTMISEVIKIETNLPAARFFNEDYQVELKSDPGEATETFDDRMISLPAHHRKGRKSEDIFLAFVPHDQKWLITGSVDIMIINNTSYDVLYNIFGRTHLGHYDGIDYGSMLPDTLVLLDTVNREQLTRWTEGCIQFLFHKQQSGTVLPPFNSEFRIEGKRFFKEGNYREHPLIQGKGIVARILSLSSYLGEPSAEKDPSKKQGEKSAEEVPAIMKHVTSAGEAVVDLHIHELIDDPSNMEQSEILDFQIRYFLKCLDSARMRHFRRITFIHGVGNGVLRDQIVQRLSGTEGIEYFDAPMAQYGVGALEVKLLYNG